MSNLLLKTADVLDTLAAHLDTEQGLLEQQKVAVHQTTAEQWHEKLTTLTGEDVPQETLEKLAAMDDDGIRQLLDQLTTKVASDEEPDDLGHTYDEQDTVVSTTRERTKQAAAEADEKFLQWCLS